MSCSLTSLPLFPENLLWLPVTLPILSALNNNIHGFFDDKGICKNGETFTTIKKQCTISMSRLDSFNTKKVIQMTRIIQIIRSGCNACIVPAHEGILAPKESWASIFINIYGVLLNKY